MEQTLLDTALTQSIWAALAIALIFYILKYQEKREQVQAAREERYQELVADLTMRLKEIEELKQDVKKIAEILSA